jgi:hypothetical protein
MDETTLLCERCGYNLSGTGPDGVCPECGLTVGESLPARRTGSPWQRRPGPLSWVRTGLATLLRPTRTFRALRIRPEGATLLSLLNLWLAGALIADPWVGTFIADPARTARDLSDPRQLGLYAVSWLVWGLGVGWVLLLLTWVEYAGVRFFAARRGWRLTRAAAWQVCAHSTVGWLVCGSLAILILAAVQACVRLFGMPLGGQVDLKPYVPIRIDIGDVVLVGGPLVGYLAGLLAFETLVYKGVRVCRYATLSPAVGAA